MPSSPRASTSRAATDQDWKTQARNLAATTVRDESKQVDQDAFWPVRSFAAMQRQGLSGLVVPRTYGGLGLGLAPLLEVCETFGKECASFAISYGMHCVGAAVVAAKATPGQEKILNDIAAGRHITTLALSEPGSGAHFYYPSSEITAEGDGYRLNGSKSFVTNGGHADSYVVSTATATSAEETGLFSCVLVPKDADGLTWDAPYHGFGMRGNSARTAHLDNIALGPEALLGKEGDQIWYVFNVVAPYFLMAMAGTYLGIAQRALDECVAHLSGREYAHSGSRLGESPVLQHRLGTMWGAVERTRRLCYWAAEEADRGGPDALPALCSAKAEVADCAVNTTNEAMTLMGGERTAMAPSCRGCCGTPARPT